MLASSAARCFAYFPPTVQQQQQQQQQPRPPPPNAHAAANRRYRQRLHEGKTSRKRRTSEELAALSTQPITEQTPEEKRALRNHRNALRRADTRYAALATITVDSVHAASILAAASAAVAVAFHRVYPKPVIGELHK